MSLVTPKFLTKEVAAEAVHIAFQAMFVVAKPTLKPKRDLAHVAIVAPARRFEHTEMRPQDIGNSIVPIMLYEESFGDPDDFPYPFDDIARSKARELWFGQQDGGTDLMPHLLFQGDTPYWGGVKRYGFAVACSGIDPWNDRAIAGIVADSMAALAYGAWMRSKDKAEGVSFLS